MRRVVVTGLGWTTPLGLDLDGVWTRLVRGDVAVTTPTRHGGGEAPTRAAGEMGSDLLGQLETQDPEAWATGDLRTVLGVAAGERALQDAGLGGTGSPRAGVVLGSGPGVHRLEDVRRFRDGEGLDAVALGRDVSEVHEGSLLRHAAEAPSVFLARRHHLGGPVHAVTSACSAANQALGLAFRAIQRGEVDWMLAGGTDGMLDPVGLVFFVLLGASAKVEMDPAAACRPFDRKRSGIVIGEGAGLAVLEDLEHARARGARIYAEVVGYGATMDAYRITAPWPDGRGAAAAVAEALRTGKIPTDEVDYVSAHGTGTKRNDPAEVQAVRDILGPHAERVSVSSIKGALGHLLAGAGGVAFVASALAIANGEVPPTANLEAPDPQMELDFVPGRGKAREVRAALNNAFAFGGQNSCIALVRPKEDR